MVNVPPLIAFTVMVALVMVNEPVVPKLISLAPVMVVETFETIMARLMAVPPLIGFPVGASPVLLSIQLASLKKRLSLAAPFQV